MSARLILILLSATIFQACQNAAAPVAISNKPVSVNDARQPNVIEQPVARLSWTGMDGSQQQIGDLKNKVIVLDFWATYCVPCRDEIPHLNSLQAKYGKDLQVVGLNVGGREDQPKIPAFAKQLKVSYQIAIPEQPLVSYIFGTDDSIPKTAVFDRQGRHVLTITGFDTEIQSELDRAVDAAIRQ